MASPRSIGNATISFGLVSIPVKLYSATQSAAGISFNMLHGKCGSRIKQQYFCPTDNEVVERSELVKGYEFAKDRYVTFTPEELKALEEQATEAIEITEFVPASTVDPVYFDKAYYLSPDKGGDKAFRLLAEVMRRAGKVGLARYAARGKQYLVMLRPGPEGGSGTSVVMQQLLYADKVRPISEIPLPEAKAQVKEGELALAEELVSKVSNDEFHPEAYHDDVKDRILAQVQKKAEGETLSLAPAPAERAQVIDLMEALKQSLAAAGASQAGAGQAGERKPPKRAVSAPTKAKSQKK
jgi:DNA end-binding protein Ku